MKLRDAYRWFRGHGFGATAALAYARAECLAKAAGCVYQWEDDPEGWADVSDYDDEPQETCEGCVLLSPAEDGEVWCEANRAVLASLWGIWDADDDYRRIVQAELALEAQDAILSILAPSCTLQGAPPAVVADWCEEVDGDGETAAEIRACLSFA